MENQDVFSEFEGKLTNLNNNLIGYSDMIDEFISANAVLEAEIKPQTENCRSSAARFRMARRVSRIRRAI